MKNRVINDAIREYLQPLKTSEFNGHFRAALTDLYNGPTEASIVSRNYGIPQYSFSRSVMYLSEWISELPTLYYCNFSGYIETEQSDDCIVIGHSDIKIALFGSKLAPYIQ